MADAAGERRMWHPQLSHVRATTAIITITRITTSVVQESFRGVKRYKERQADGWTY